MSKKKYRKTFNNLRTIEGLKKIRKLLEPYLSQDGKKLYIIDYKKGNKQYYDFFNYKEGKDSKGDLLDDLFTIDEEGNIDNNDKLISLKEVDKFINYILKEL